MKQDETGNETGNVECDSCGVTFAPSELAQDEHKRLVCAECDPDLHADKDDADDAPQDTAQGDEDARAAEAELAPVRRALDTLEEELARGEKKGDGFVARVFGRGQDPLESARDAVRTVKAELETTIAVARGRHARLRQVRADLEQDARAIERRTLAQREQYALSVVTAEQKGQAALALANDRMQVAREAIETVGEARKLRDETMSAFNQLRVKVVGLARALGAKIVTCDENEAIEWLLKNAKVLSQEQRQQRDVALADRMARMALLADLEVRADEATNPEARATLLTVVDEWRQALNAPLPTQPVDQKVEDMKKKLEAQAATKEATS